MGCGYGSRYKANHAQAWREIEALDPDVALLQEVLRVPESIDPSRVERAPRNRAGTFQTVVYVRRGSLVRIEPEPTLSPVVGGQVVLAEVTGLSISPVVVASIHTLTGAPEKQAQEAFNALPDSVRGLLPEDRGSWNAAVILRSVAQHTRDRRFVVGGDLNLAWRFDEVQGGKTSYWASEQFRALRSEGWRRCHLKFHAGEERTLFRRPDELYQLDHLFADAETYGAATCCDVLQLDDLQELSDHAPLVLEIESEAPGASEEVTARPVPPG